MVETKVYVEDAHMRAGLAVVHSAPPAYWVLFLTRFLHASEPLARHLWQVYVTAYPHTSVTVAFQLRAMLADCASPAAWRQRLGRIQEVVSPAFLCALCVRLAPEDGGPRRRDVVELEEAILSYTKGGGWKCN